MDVPPVADDGFLYRLVDGLFGIIGVTMSFFLKTAHRKIDQQSDDINDLRQEHYNFKTTVAENYVKNGTLDRIDDKLEYIIKELLRRNNQ
jgi:hypothetical protein